MVMEAQPSPRSVGREFVRQYYTLLNESPDHLHRFYSNNSIYVHGGPDDRNSDLSPAVGQKQIHQRIEQLNFKDCHAKIAQVDSLPTLGNGVVVQVSGELSNAGQPMRRFTQTFVLASQTPTKYYVHNDIFRYQDMFFDEEVEQGSGRLETEEDQIEPEHNQVADMQSQNQSLQSNYYGVPVAVNGAHHDEVPVQAAVAPTPQGLPPTTLIQPMQQPPYMPTVDYLQQQQQQQQTPQQPPVSAIELQPPPTQQQPQPVSQPPQQPPVNQAQMMAGPPSGVGVGDMYHSAGEHEQEEEEVEEEEIAAVPEDASDKQNLESYPALEQDHTASSQENTAQSNEPKTYATLLKSGTSGINTSPQAPTKSPSSPPPGIRMDNRNNESNLASTRGPMPSRGGRGTAPSIRGMGRGNMDWNSAPPRSAPNDDAGNFGGDSEKRRVPRDNSQNFPDSHQLFLGNLPPDATEDDLKDLFSKFGTVVDLKIMSKPTAIKNQGVTVIKPNYAFIIFEEETAVTATLEERPFMFNSCKLNVEEKRARNSRPPMDNRMGSGGGGVGARGSHVRRGGGATRSYGGQGRGGNNYIRGGAGPMRPNGPSYNSRLPPR